MCSDLIHQRLQPLMTYQLPASTLSVEIPRPLDIGPKHERDETSSSSSSSDNDSSSKEKRQSTQDLRCVEERKHLETLENTLDIVRLERYPDTLPYMFLGYRMSSLELEEDFIQTSFSTKEHIEFPLELGSLLPPVSSLVTLQKWLRTTERKRLPGEPQFPQAAKSVLRDYSVISFEKYWNAFEKAKEVEFQSPPPPPQDRESLVYHTFYRAFRHPTLLPLPPDTVLYEGYGKHEVDYPREPIGQVRRRNRPTSTTWHPNVALNFASSDYLTTGVIVIYTVRGKTLRGLVLDMLNATLHPQEFEILLQPYVYYKVTRIEQGVKEYKGRHLNRYAMPQTFKVSMQIYADIAATEADL